MYFKVAVFWLYPYKGARVSDYLGFPKVGKENRKKKHLLFPRRKLYLRKTSLPKSSCEEAREEEKRVQGKCYIATNLLGSSSSLWLFPTTT